MKIIVKSDWLPFSAPAKLRQEIQGAILNGKSLTASGLSAPEGSYCVEKSLQVAGNPSKLLASLQDLGRGEGGLAEERLFLKGFALSRLGRAREAGECFAQLPKTFEGRVQTERALVLLNQGDFLGAEALFSQAHRAAEEGLDPFSACTLLGGWTLASIQRGEFAQAEACLRNRRRILKEHRSDVLSFGTSLYEILLLLERNDFARASEQVARALRGVTPQSVNGFFLNHLKLRLNLARNELSEAQDAMETLKELQKELQIPDGVLDFRLEEVEWGVRSGAGAKLESRVAELEKMAEARGDAYFKFRLALLKSQVTLHAGNPTAALKEIQKAVETGESRSYLPGLAWAYFHAAGISIAGGNTVLAKLYLMKGRRLSEQLGLRVRLAGFEYMTEVLESRYASASALLSLAKHREIGPELEYFLNSYHLLQSVALGVWDGKSREVLREPELRRLLFRSPGLFWFQKESVLLAHPESGPVAAIEFPDDSALSALFRLFWKEFQSGKQSSLTLRDVHRVRLDVPFREELHTGAAKMLLSRLRDKLKPSGIEIAYRRETGRYGLRSALPGFTIHSREGSEAAPRDREKELLERISMEAFVPTRALCEEFKVSRQALHPLLQKLCREKKLRLVKRGPISGYMRRLG